MRIQELAYYAISLVSCVLVIVRALRSREWHRDFVFLGAFSIAYLGWVVFGFGWRSNLLWGISDLISILSCVVFVGAVVGRRHGVLILGSAVALALALALAVVPSVVNTLQYAQYHASLWLFVGLFLRIEKLAAIVTVITVLRRPVQATATARFAPPLRNALPPQVCSGCGRRADGEAIFCTNCGARLTVR